MAQTDESGAHLIHTSAGISNRIEGVDHDGTISLVLSRNPPGPVTRLHRHPYDETWVVQTGTITFHAGDSVVRAQPGDVINVPANTPHKFTNDGPEMCDVVCIHPSPSIIEEFRELAERAGRLPAPARSAQRLSYRTFSRNSRVRASLGESSTSRGGPYSTTAPPSMNAT
jgi:quercetin dioxygenase-like cupin family protein